LRKRSRAWFGPRRDADETCPAQRVVERLGGGRRAALGPGPRGVDGGAGLGRTLTQAFAAQPDVDIAYFCDVDSTVVEPALQWIEKSGRPRPPVVRGIRRCLDERSVDAIVMGMPLHWHAPGTILACAAGKDVYVEKPASHNIREGGLMVEVARRHQRMVQSGTRLPSLPVTQRFQQYVESGPLVRVLMAKVWNVQLRRNIGSKADEPVPAGLDYDIWTGPLPLARALNVGLPRSVSGMGRRFYFDDDQQTPDTMNLTYDYREQLLQCEQRLWNPYGLEACDNGVANYGDRAVAQFGHFRGKQWGFRVLDEKNQRVHEDQHEGGSIDVPHARDFLDRVKSRRRPRVDIEEGYLSTALAHLGNIVARTGRAIRVAGESIAGDREAEALTRRDYRRHWSAPRMG